MEIKVKQEKVDLSKLITEENVSTLPGYGMFKDELHLPDGWNSQEERERDTTELMAILNREADV